MISKRYGWGLWSAITVGLLTASPTTALANGSPALLTRASVTSAAGEGRRVDQGEGARRQPSAAGRTANPSRAGKATPVAKGAAAGPGDAKRQAAASAAGAKIRAQGFGAKAPAARGTKGTASSLLRTPRPLSAREEMQLARLRDEALASHEPPEVEVVVTSLSLTESVRREFEGGGAEGVEHVAKEFQVDEERSLTAAVAKLERNPRLEVYYVSRAPIAGEVLAAHFRGLSDANAASRFHVLTPEPALAKGPQSLTQTVLRDKKLLGALKRATAGRRAAYIPYNTTPDEARLSIAIRAPMQGSDPRAVERWGTKTGNHELFEYAFANTAIRPPAAEIDLHSEAALGDAVAKLVERLPSLDKVMVKLNEGEAGAGNATFDLSKSTAVQRWKSLTPAQRGSKARAALRAGLARELPAGLAYVDRNLTWGRFVSYMGERGAIAEEFIDKIEGSPSVQGYVHADGRVEVLSTHEQVLEGQVFVGSRFPASDDYRARLQEIGQRVGTALAAQRRDGVVEGRFAVDTVAVRDGKGGWELRPVEINIRQGGTTYAYDATRALSGAKMTPDGRLLYTAPNGASKALSYVSTDKANVAQGLTAREVVGALERAGLLFDRSTMSGVRLTMLDTLRFGRVGFFALGGTPAEASKIYERTSAVLARLEPRAKIGLASGF